MLRNHWYLPDRKSSIIAQKYMNSVRTTELWCPKFNEIHPLPCPDPPKKAYLLDELKLTVGDRWSSLGISAKKVPDKQWILAVLGSLNPNHQVFQKSYRPPVNLVKKEDKVIDNSDDFYSSLPMLVNKRDLKAKSKLTEYKVASY